MGFVAQVHAPTVTMPRIKALTTGSIPGFVDVLLNFGSKDLGKILCVIRNSLKLVHLELHWKSGLRLKVALPYF